MENKNNGQRKFYHTYEIYFTKDKTIFDRPFMEAEYEWYNDCVESTYEADIVVRTIQHVRPDVERILVMYSIHSVATDDVEDLRCEESTIVVDLEKQSDGTWKYLKIDGGRTNNEQ